MERVLDKYTSFGRGEKFSQQEKNAYVVPQIGYFSKILVNITTNHFQEYCSDHLPKGKWLPNISGLIRARCRW